jgi:poly(3-hydroxyalkanoate) synthetase
VLILSVIVIVNISTSLSVHLVGFSRGGIVLNQLVAELAVCMHSTEATDNNYSHDATALTRRQFFSMV